MTKCSNARRKREKKHDRKRRTHSSMKLQRKDSNKFDLKVAQYYVNQSPEHHHVELKAQVEKLQRQLAAACQEISSYESHSFRNKNKDIKRVRRVRKKSYHDEKAHRELHTLMNRMKSIRKINRDSFKNLMREFKNLTKKEQEILNAESGAKFSCSSKFTGILTQGMEKEHNRAMKNEAMKIDISGSDEDSDGANNSGSDEVKHETSAEAQKSFLLDLESQLFNKKIRTKKTKLKKQRKKIPKSKFKKLKTKLDDLLVQKLDDYVKVDIDELDHDEFDFCDIPEEPKQPVCPINQEKFKNAMNIIKQKKYKLKKTRRLVQEIEGVKVKSDSAYKSALSKIFKRRKYFDIEDENEENVEVEI